MSNEKPVHEVRLGAVKAAIWKNTTPQGVRFNVTFARLYKDENEWKSSDSFGRDDLLVLGKVADRAHSWIFDHVQAENSQSDHGQEEKENGEPARRSGSGKARS